MEPREVKSIRSVILTFFAELGSNIKKSEINAFNYHNIRNIITFVIL